AGEFDSVLAQWWMDLANADDVTRAEMIEEVSRLPREAGDVGGVGPAASTSPRKRRRPRRSPSRGPSNAE
ncbi:MAG: polynucleotide adenylyltransferase PcnB, partial [Achromobacter piechaudii]